MIVRPPAARRAEPQNWLTYSGNLFNQRHSPLTQITPANVKNLELQWIWQARSLEKFEATSLVVDGVLYTVQARRNEQSWRSTPHRTPVLDLPYTLPPTRATAAAA